MISGGGQDSAILFRYIKGCGPCKKRYFIHLYHYIIRKQRHASSYLMRSFQQTKQKRYRFNRIHRVTKIAKFKTTSFSAFPSSVSNALALDCTRLLRSIRWRERTGWRRQSPPRAPLFKKSLYIFFERVRIGTEAPCVNSIVPFNVTLDTIQ